MQRILLAFMLTAASACAQADTLKELANAHIDCLLGHIAKLDDGVSPASDIADAVKYKCFKERQNFYMGADPSGGLYNATMSNAEAEEKDLATTLVLELRAARKNKEKGGAARK